MIITVLSVSNGRERWVITVDPDYADAWKVEPYFSTMKEWMARGADIKLRIGSEIITL